MKETYRGEKGKKTWSVGNLSGEVAVGVGQGDHKVLGGMGRTWSLRAAKGHLFSFVHTLNQTQFDSTEFPPPLLFPVVSSRAPSRAVVPSSQGFPFQSSLHNTNEY